MGVFEFDKFAQLGYRGRIAIAGCFICKLYISVKTFLIFLAKILGLHETLGRKASCTPLQQLQNVYSHKSCTKSTIVIVANELDNLIAKSNVNALEEKSSSE